MTDNNLPILLGHISYNGPDCCQIAVFCPYCHRNHHHGWPSRSAEPGRLEHRVCHCFDTPRRRAKDSPYWGKGYLIGIDPNRKNLERHR